MHDDDGGELPHLFEILAPFVRLPSGDPHVLHHSTNRPNSRGGHGQIHAGKRDVQDEGREDCPRLLEYDPKEAEFHLGESRRNAVSE